MTDNAKNARPPGDDGDDPLPDRLADLLGSQYNVVSRKQAARYGITESQLRHRLRPGGPWKKILPGVYSTETGAVTQDQRQMAALLYAGPEAVVTGAAAVRRHRLDCAGGNNVEVLVPAKSRVKGHGYVRIQRTTRLPGRTFSTRKIVFAPLARAVGDAARAMLKPEEVRALISEAVHKGVNCTVEDLIAELAAGPSAGSRLFRFTLAEISEGIRSEAERDLKFCIDQSNLPTPMYNARLYLPDGTFLAMPDAWWPRAGVAGEVDSLRHHILAKDHAETMARRNRMEAADVRVLQFLPKDIKPRWPVHCQDLREAIAKGMKRPPLPIIAIPANVTDIRTFLLTKLSVTEPPSDSNYAIAAVGQCT
jgi:hypothetical protein